MYGLVADVGEYWQFMPWCSWLDVLPHHGQVLRAELEVGFPLLLEHYLSQVFPASGWIRVGRAGLGCCRSCWGGGRQAAPREPETPTPP